MLKAKPRDDHFRLGLMFALGSAAMFGMSGPFARALMSAGWTPTAAAAARLAVGAVVMAAFATATRPGWFREAAQHIKTIVSYGIVPIAGAQLFFYNAVQHLPVAVALLLEFTAPVLVVGWLWLRTGHRPGNRTLAGVGLAVAGMMLVLDLFDAAGHGGGGFDVTGVAWGLAAAVCAACYFLMSDTGTATDDDALHPVTLAAGGLIVGAAAVALLGATGVLPMAFTANPVQIAGFTTSPVVAVAMLAVFSTAAAYTLGITGIALLRPGFASLVGLAEVMFAVLWAWLLVGEAVTGMQAIGGAVVLVGLALARRGDRANVPLPPAQDHAVT